MPQIKTINRVIAFLFLPGFFLSLTVGFMPAPALAQPDPRSLTMNLLTNATASTFASEAKLSVRTEVVNLEVNVLDRRGFPVVGLGSEQFEIYENGVRQSIEYFRVTDGPASIGVVFDVSGSMKTPLKKVQEAFRTFLNTAHPDDEFCLILVQEKPQLALDFTGGEELLRKISTVQAQGNTALRDGMALGLEKLQQARHKRRALLVISDGVDNYSRLEQRQLFQQIKESEARIYAIGTAEFNGVTCNTLCRLGAQQLLDGSAQQTGGEAFFLTSRQSLDEATYRIALLLRQQYSLGYAPTNEARQGRWRKVEIKVKENSQKAIVRSRKGYYESKCDALQGEGSL